MIRSSAKTAPCGRGRQLLTPHQPSACDPRQVSAVEARLWQLLPDAVTGIELSPVGPLGSCTAVAPVSQNRVLTTVRLSEVVADSTNGLAIEAAVVARTRLLTGRCTSPHPTGSSPRRSSARARLRIELSVFGRPGLAARLADTVLPATHGDVVEIMDEPSREHRRGYYTALAIRLSADAGGLEIGDGGFTTSTAQLPGNAKARCLVTCIATERLTELIVPS